VDLVVGDGQVRDDLGLDQLVARLEPLGSGESALVRGKCLAVAAKSGQQPGGVVFQTGTPPPQSLVGKNQAGSMRVLPNVMRLAGVGGREEGAGGSGGESEVIGARSKLVCRVLVRLRRIRVVAQLAQRIRAGQ